MKSTMTLHDIASLISATVVGTEETGDQEVRFFDNDKNPCKVVLAKGAKDEYSMFVFKRKEDKLWKVLSTVGVGAASVKVINQTMRNLMAKKAAVKKFTKSENNTTVYRESTAEFLEAQELDSDLVVDIVTNTFGDEDSTTFLGLISECEAVLEIVSGDEFTRQLLAAASIPPYEDPVPEADDDDADDDGDDDEEDAPPIKKSKKAKAPKEAKAKAAGRAPSWGPGFVREPTPDAKKGTFNVNQLIGKVIKAVGKGNTIEKIAAAVGVDEKQVKFQLRTAARSCGLGFSIDKKGILTIQGDYELVNVVVDQEGKMAKLRAAAAAKREAAKAAGQSTRKRKAAPVVEEDEDDVEDDVEDDDDDVEEAPPVKKARRRK